MMAGTATKATDAVTEAAPLPAAAVVAFELDAAVVVAAAAAVVVAFALDNVVVAAPVVVAFDGAAVVVVLFWALAGIRDPSTATRTRANATFMMLV